MKVIIIDLLRNVYIFVIQSNDIVIWLDMLGHSQKRRNEKSSYSLHKDKKKEERGNVDIMLWCQSMKVELWCECCE